MTGEAGFFMAGFLAATLLAWVARRRGMRRIERLQRENADLLGEESRMFSFLHELGESLSHDRGLRKLNEEIVNGVTRVVGATGGALYLVDPRNPNQLIPSGMTKNCPPLIDLPPEVLQKTSANAVGSFLRLKAVPASGGVLGYCFENQGAMNFGRLGQWPQLFESLQPEQANLHVMAAPMTLAGRKMGVLAVARSNRPFSVHDYDVFRSVAEQGAFALASAMIQREAMEKRRMEEELRSASEVQRILLPRKAPEIGDYIIVASNTPAKVMSGDYYDFIRLDDSHMGVVIADVSGKGFPASLVMATCRALLRGQAVGELSPSAALSKVNRMLFGDIREDMFISLAYCVLDKNAPTITLARAGHDAPLHYRRRTGEVAVLKPPGLALGVDGGKVFERVTKDFVFDMEPGDCLLLYTDGVNEAVNEEGEEFGMERLTEMFRASAPSGAQHVLEAFETAIGTFVGGSPQSDDITIIVVERR